VVLVTGRRLAQQLAVEQASHAHDGRIAAKASYGNDPLPSARWSLGWCVPVNSKRRAITKVGAQVTMYPASTLLVALH